MAQTTIKLLLLDIDGVLTDGSIIYDADGTEIKRFNVRDGLGIVEAQRVGLKIGVLTGRPSAVTSLRLKELGVELVEQVPAVEKPAGYERLIAAAGVSDDEVAYMGDDLADLPILDRVSVSMAPADAIPEVLDKASFISDFCGGRGAVRQAIEYLLKQDGRWDQVVRRFTG